MNFIGWHYKEGAGVDKDPAESVAWFQKSADLGNSEALVYLAMAYEKGEGVPQDSEKAMALYQQAGTAGEEAGSYGAGRMHQETADYQEAAKWYRMAAEKGHGNSLRQLAYFALYGSGQEKDEALAKKLAEQALSAGADDMEELVSLLDIK